MSKQLNIGFQINAPMPIDARMQVATFADLDLIPVKYHAMVTWVLDEDADYRWNSAVPEWVAIAGAAPVTWGSIVGTIDDQLDLMARLDLYSLVTHTHTQLPPLAHTHLEAEVTDLDKYKKSEVEPLSTGLNAGGDITINVNPALFDIARGDGFKNEWLPNVPSLPPVISTVDFGPFLGVVPTFLATDPVTYIGIAYDSGLTTATVVQQNTPFTPTQRRDTIVLGILVHSDNASITEINPVPTNHINTTSQTHDVLDALGTLNLSGNIYSPNGANLSLDKSAGVILKRGSNFYTDNKAPHHDASILDLATTFKYKTQTSIQSADTTNMDPDNWDSAGVVTAVTAGYWTVQRVYLLPGGRTRIQYAQTEFEFKEDAIANMATSSFVEEPECITGVLRVYVALQQGTTVLDNTDFAELINVGKFGTVQRGASSAGGDKTFVHIEATPLTVWNIPHSMNKYPSIRVLDQLGNRIFGDEEYVDLNTVQITYLNGIQGTAYLN